MKIAIIGSGASGLTAIKCCLDEGLKPVCFERQDQIGGLWNYVPGEKEGATVYKSTVINTSKEMMCYSDFPIPKEFPNFMHNTFVYKYFKLYEERFNLRQYIKFNIKVLSCSKAEGFNQNGNWKVTTEDVKTKVQTTEYFDGILVCVGHHAIPHYPLEDFPGIEKFKGKRLHSHDFRDCKGFEGLKVAVVGIGNSGGDIAVELSRHSEQVFLSTRRGAWIFNRVHDNGMPLDINLGRRHVRFLTQALPISFTIKGVEKTLNKRFDHAMYSLKPKHRVFSQHPNVNDELPNRILTGSIRVKSNIASFTENKAIFDDGTEEEVDAVIFATGYSIDYPFLDESVIKVVENDSDLYKYMWPIELSKPTLAIIGAVQPLGAINPIAEMQCRWATRVFKGDNVLPTKDEMKQDLAAKKVAMSQQYVKSRRHTVQIEYIDYMDQIAKQIGCLPNILKHLVTDPQLGSKLLFGPNAPYVYRLDGPGRWPGARQAILTVMDRVLYPLQTRKVEESPEGSFGFLFVIVLLIAVLLGLYSFIF